MKIHSNDCKRHGVVIRTSLVICYIYMMILRLFCPMCAYHAAKVKNQKGSSRIEIDVPMPVSRPSDDGRYEVRCAAGHVSTVIVDNVKFEILFEMGINALVDGYPREAVSSFASALERYYEFYWHVVANHYSIPINQVDSAWKAVGKQSERQLGMFVTASLLLTNQCPPLLKSNSEVMFRNKVIHGGYIPTLDEATSFGDVVMILINESLAVLRDLAPDALARTYEQFSPAEKEEAPVLSTDIEWNDDEEHSGTINIPTAVDVRYPVTTEHDPRRGGVKDQFKRIIQDRNPQQLTLMDEMPRQS